MSQQNGPRADDCPPCECEETMSGDAEKDAKAFSELNPDAAAVIRGHGAVIERERIAAIGELAEPGEEALAAKFIKDGAAVDKAALGFAAARKEARAAAALARAGDTPAPIVNVPLNPAASESQDKRPAAQKTDDELTADYGKSDTLKAEFTSAAGYIAFVRAEAGGRARIKSSRT